MSHDYVSQALDFAANDHYKCRNHQMRPIEEVHVLYAGVWHHVETISWCRRCGERESTVHRQELLNQRPYKTVEL